MSYALFRRSYDGNLLIGKADTSYKNYRPFSWNAEVHFTLSRSRVLLREFKLSTGRSVVEAKGQIQDFNRPDFSNTKIEVDYDTTVDIAEAAAIARQPEFRRGSVRLTGHGVWSPRDFSSIGKVLLSNLDWRDSPVGLHNANLSAQYALNPTRVTLSQVQGRIFGGSVSGDAEVNQWLNLQTANSISKGSGKEAEKQIGTVRLRFRDLSAAEMAAVFSTPARPLHRV